MRDKSAQNKNQSFAPNFKFGMLTTANTKYTNTMPTSTIATTRSKGSPKQASIDKTPENPTSAGHEPFHIMNSPEGADLEILRMSEKTHSNPSSVTEEESFEESSSDSNNLTRTKRKSLFG
mmetsp:Transcript_9440/g.14486  ORF Transcript_9440/g.14486 Transcript_9440/m.14486 type:complete len:121 (+) Transcript_9440:1511-1873(+)